MKTTLTKSLFNVFEEARKTGMTDDEILEMVKEAIKK